MFKEMKMGNSDEEESDFFKSINVFNLWKSV